MAWQNIREQLRWHHSESLVWWTRCWLWIRQQCVCCRWQWTAGCTLSAVILSILK